MPSLVGGEFHYESGIDTAFYEVLMPLYPNILVDISGLYASKETALKCYDTELNYKEYVSLVEGLDRVRTATLGAEIRYAEAFARILHEGGKKHKGFSNYKKQLSRKSEELVWLPYVPIRFQSKSRFASCTIPLKP